MLFGVPTDYLGMSEHPVVLAALRDGIDRTGPSAGGTWDLTEASELPVHENITGSRMNADLQRCVAGGIQQTGAEPT